MEGRKQRDLGSMVNIGREQEKYDLRRWEQRGNFRTGAGSMGHPYRGS